MKIKIKQTIDVPKSLYCDGCRQIKQVVGGQQVVCGVFGLGLRTTQGGKFVKCDICASALLEQLRRE